jgi:MbtH protein
VTDDAAEDTHTYTVLVNDEEQYSLWLTELAIPGGWRSTGQVGSKQECLDYVRRVWTDLRPLSLRKALAAQARDGG